MNSMIRNRRRRQSGQAIAELAVCLVVLIVCFLGILLTAAISRERVNNVILSRTDADDRRQSLNLYGHYEGTSIQRWDYGGNDEIGLPAVPFTADDRKVTGDQNDSSFFDQLQDNTGNFVLGQVDTSSIPFATNAARLMTAPLYLSAAGLLRGASSNDDPLEEHFKELKAAVNNLFGISSFSMSDETFLPGRAAVPLPEEQTQ